MSPRPATKARAVAMHTMAVLVFAAVLLFIAMSLLMFREIMREAKETRDREESGEFCPVFCCKCRLLT